jgi:hypothetical protein
MLAADTCTAKTASISFKIETIRVPVNRDFLIGPSYHENVNTSG